MQIDLRGKVAIVTGASRGIGREIASTLASEGVTTVVTDVRQDLLDEVAKDFAARGWTGQQYVCDVRDAARIAEVVDAVVRALGRIAVLVNNAGVAPGAPVEQLSEETWDLNMDVNLKGTFLMCRAVAPVMKRQRAGRIINAASFAAILPIVGSAAYAASKAGVHYFTRVLAGELGPWGVTVNCYAPG
jgi:3-oxoacyl-[acyl-carrier protein] reductase